MRRWDSRPPKRYLPAANSADICWVRQVLQPSLLHDTHDLLSVVLCLRVCSIQARLHYNAEHISHKSQNITWQAQELWVSTRLMQVKPTSGWCAAGGSQSGSSARAKKTLRWALDLKEALREASYPR
eukprot:3705413-Pleurochrysis_carterae.AAC.1